MYYALCDCNNFFVSCERVFRPDLEGKPVVVLSGNDGCVVSRSNEAKKLGIKMGEPWFEVRRRLGEELNYNAIYEPIPEDKMRWQGTGYYLLKYVARRNGNHGQIADGDMNHCNNIRVYRYAETLLNAAELSVLTGKDGSRYLQEVRDRANCKDSGTDQEAIIAERRKEFLANF